MAKNPPPVRVTQAGGSGTGRAVRAGLPRTREVRGAAESLERGVRWRLFLSCWRAPALCGRLSFSPPRRDRRPGHLLHPVCLPPEPEASEAACRSRSGRLCSGPLQASQLTDPLSHLQQ